MTAERLAGTYNLRDLGGFQVRGGVLRPWRLVRSGELDDLSDEAAAVLAAKGLRHIVDFRSAAERDGAPTRATAFAAMPRWQTAADAVLGDPAPILRNCLISAEQSRDTMCGVYRSLPYAHRDAYRALFELAAAGVPLIFHCAAGKDRTGVAAALLLDLLGAERDAIRSDFAASDAVIDATTRRFIGKPGGMLTRGVSPDVWRPMMLADPLYIDTMFEEITARHGDTAGYAKAVLGLETGFFDRLRKALVQDAP